MHCTVHPGKYCTLFPPQKCRDIFFFPFRAPGPDAPREKLPGVCARRSCGVKRKDTISSGTVAGRWKSRSCCGFPQHPATPFLSPDCRSYFTTLRVLSRIVSSARKRRRSRPRNERNSDAERNSTRDGRSVFSIRRGFSGPCSRTGPTKDERCSVQPGCEPGCSREAPTTAKVSERRKRSWAIRRNPQVLGS